MSRKFPLGGIIRRIRSQLDIDDGDHIQDTDILDRLTSARSALNGILAASGHRWREERFYWTGADMVDATEDHSSEDDGAFYKLPPNVQNIVGVDQKLSRWIPLDEFMVQDRNSFSWPGRGRVCGWEVRNDRVYLFPKPASSATVKFRALFIPTTPAFKVGESETPDNVEVDVLLPEGEQYLIWYVVAELKDKSEDDYRFALSRLQHFDEQARIWAVRRSIRNHRRPAVNDEYYSRRRSRWGGEYDY